ncbi:hypothetical protein TorRG33x02_338080 [Trema orientale]|uniref:Zinc finger, CCHC-type n=1 Tax=Trema orientale TaxID=63057 RepID=A0A2P5AY04_TREOI|nr:hypothetical protein TorRG33x02_338080 [Trema orientale]
MVDTIQAQTVGYHTASDVWQAVGTIFGSQSKAKIMQYKLQLQTLKKGGMSMREYLLKMKSAADVLASAGHVVSEEDQILYVLARLGIEYDSVVVSITSCPEPYTLTDLGALLLAQEGRIEQHSATTDGTNPSVNLAFQTQPPNGQKPNSGSNSYGKNQLSPHFSNNCGRGRGNCGGRRSWNGEPHVQCQLCGKFGHTVLRCYYRFDQNFFGFNNNNCSDLGPLLSSPTNTSHANMSTMVATPDTFFDCPATSSLTLEPPIM